jgi:hypothetical protein
VGVAAAAVGVARVRQPHVSRAASYQAPTFPAWRPLGPARESAGLGRENRCEVSPFLRRQACRTRRLRSSRAGPRGLPWKQSGFGASVHRPRFGCGTAGGR